MKATKIIIIIIYLLYSTVYCEELTLEQKIDIFGYLIQDNDPMFYIYLMNKILSIYQNLSNFRSEQEIKFYVEMLIIEFYKN